jgi:hypothetical protein
MTAMRISARSFACAALSVSAATLSAQSISDRVRRVDDGSVRLTFAAREGLCGRGNSIEYGPHSRMTWDSNRYSRDVEWDVDCDYGPVRLVLDVRDGEVSAIKTYVGGRWRKPNDRTVDLGTVGARQAADYLLSLAGSLSGKSAQEAIFPATLADSATVWPQLLRLARNDSRPRSVRQQSVFWLGQMAGDKVADDLGDLVKDDDVDREVREQAVFALSQRPKEEGIPALIKIVRSNRDPEIRKKALFWLGQSGDPRALDVIEEILTKR